MEYRGTVRNGVVIFEDGGTLPEGTLVRVEPLGGPFDSLAEQESVGQRLLELAGIVDDLPEDMALNHDHYLHGHPKR
jgi:hypothetical protein